MLKEVAEEVQATANQVVLAWMVSHGIIPVTGASKAYQMSESLEAADISLSEEQLARLDRTGVPQEPDSEEAIRARREIFGYEG